MITEKINVMVSTCKEDKDALELIYDMLDSCRRYFDIIIAHAHVVNVQRFRLQDEQYRELLRDLHERRSLTHNAMCHLIRACDRLCVTLGIEKIYGGENHRIDYAKFARDLCIEYFNAPDVEDIDP